MFLHSSRVEMFRNVFISNRVYWFDGGAIIVYGCASIAAEMNLFFNNSCGLNGMGGALALFSKGGVQPNTVKSCLFVSTLTRQCHERRRSRS